jgi:peptidyl-prolyl cis-trans isomerase B (cyclophilin B)
LIALVVFTALALASGCGGDDEDDGGGGEAETGSTQTASAACEQAEEPEARRVRERDRPDLRLSADESYTAVVETSCGEFEIELDPKDAPKTGGSFVSLARDGFYDGLTFHRIVPGFVIQGGDPTGNGSGGPGYSVREAPPDDVVYSEGVVAMAKTAAEPAGTSGSQFFVVTSDEAALEPDYAVLGKVTKGLDVVHRIERVQIGADERPVEPVVIERIRIRTG